MSKPKKHQLIALSSIPIIIVGYFLLFSSGGVSSIGFIFGVILLCAGFYIGIDSLVTLIAYPPKRGLEQVPSAVPAVTVPAPVSVTMPQPVPVSVAPQPAPTYVQYVPSTRITAFPLGIRCNSWTDFKHLASKSKVVLFDFSEKDRVFRLHAASDDHFYVYESPFQQPQTITVTKGGGRSLPVDVRIKIKETEPSRKFAIISKQEIKNEFEFGLAYSIIPKLVKEDEKWVVELRYLIDTEEVRGLLSRELNVPQDIVAEGDLTQLI